jgi:hypothetical protein
MDIHRPPLIESHIQPLSPNSGANSRIGRPSLPAAAPAPQAAILLLIQQFL